jgi:hypothetical protein
MIAYNDSLSIEEWVGMLLLILLAEYRFDNSFVANVHIILADIGNKTKSNKSEINVDANMFPIRIIITLYVALAISTLLVTNNFAVYAQSNNHIQQKILMNSTNRGSLEIKLEPIPYPIQANKDIEFKVSFLKPNSSVLQEDIDFDFIILKDGKPVFQASNHTSRPSDLLHTANGYMTIPVLNYKFNKEDTYLVEIPVYAILYNPIRPEYANFTISIAS